METTQTTGNDININVDGVTICYDDLGKGIIPLIFVHGFPFDKTMWQPQMESFEKKYRVIAYDIRGYGKSITGKENESISLFADDLIKFMDGLEIKKAVVCGLSMGGYILLNALSRYPDRFEAIILSDTQCIADTPETKEKRSQTILQIKKEGVKDFADGFVKNIFCAETLDSKKEVVDKIKNVILATSPEVITGTLTALAERWETCSSLKEISVPSLILCGKDDKVTPPSQAEFLHKNISNSILHIIGSAGHMSNLEQPGLFNQHITDFISGLK